MHRQIVASILAAGHTNVVERFRAVVAAKSNELGAMRLARGEKEAESLTFGELDRQARSLAAWFQLQQAQGERAIMFFENGVETVYAFLGCAYGRVIAVPMPAPVSSDALRAKRYLERVRSVILDGGIRFVLTTTAIGERLREVANQMEGLEDLRWVFVDAMEDLSQQWVAEPIAESSLVYMQYTSGSTSTPKGVMISHRNLIKLIDYDGHALGHDTMGTRAVCWMPYFHDFGLIEGLLVPLTHGMPVYIMSPLEFVQNPLRWVNAVDRYRASHSSGPNFAFDLCARKSTVEQRSRLDLSCWYRASCAAEPIRSSSMRQFIEAYEPHGFDSDALVPSWGLAEATLLVTMAEAGVKYYEVDAAELMHGRVRERIANEATRTLVGCGRTWPGACDVDLRIVNPDTLELSPPGEVGEVWVSGDLVAQGYWNREAETEALFRAQIQGHPGRRYLRTGDLGFMDGSELVFAGRRKDLIIIEGRNHYPQEIEKTAERSHPALRPGCSIAFSIESQGPVRVVYVCELAKGYYLEEFAADARLDDVGVARTELEIAIRREVAEDHQVRLHEIVIVPPGTVPKTTSGKLQRSGGRMKYEHGEFSGNMWAKVHKTGLSWTQVA